MSTHTQEDTEVYQIRTLNQTTENAQPEETRKKCPIKVIQITTRIPLSLSLSLPMRLTTCIVLFSPPKKYFMCFPKKKKKR